MIQYTFNVLFIIIIIIWFYVTGMYVFSDVPEKLDLKT